MHPELTQQGQVTLDSPFGQALTEIAREAKSIFEIGTWTGMGSTRCLLAGMPPDGELISVEADPEMYKVACENHKTALANPRIRFLHGTLHRSILPYEHPIDSIQHREMYEREKQLIQSVPYIVHTRPIDLLVLDGGEFTSFHDFDLLKDQARVIALDDTYSGQTVKNVEARFDLIKNPAFEVLHDQLRDRNGWFIARRKA